MENRNPHDYHPGPALAAPGSSWPALGGLLGLSWGLLAHSWQEEADFQENVEELQLFAVRFALPGPQVGPKLPPSWGPQVGSKLAQVGPKLIQVGPKLAQVRLWAPLGASWPVLGGSWAALMFGDF